MGAVLLDEARALLDHADRVRARVSAAAGVATLTIGILGDGTDPGVARLAAAYRRSRPGIDIRIRDTDLTDPTCGLRAGTVDVALTRAPFDETALTVRALRSDPVGVVLRADDPLAGRDGLRLAELSGGRLGRCAGRAGHPSGLLGLCRARVRHDAGSQATGRCGGAPVSRVRPSSRGAAGFPAPRLTGAERLPCRRPSTR